MADEQEKPTEADTAGDAPETDGDEGGEEEEKGSGGQKIMCFVSKEMVPINETVEIEYGPGKKVRVLPKYVKYDRDEFGEGVEA